MKHPFIKLFAEAVLLGVIAILGGLTSVLLLMVVDAPKDVYWQVAITVTTVVVFLGGLELARDYRDT